MKTVYIICDIFPPAFAPRVAYLTKYISSFDWQVRVFSEQIDSHQVFSDFTPSCPVHLIDLSASSKFAKVFGQLGELLFEHKEKRMLSAIKDLVIREHLPEPQAVMCFTYRKFPLSTAYELSKYWRVPFIADCRDIIEQYSKGDFLPKPLTICGFRFRALEEQLAKVYIKQRNKYLRKANQVTTVSSWHKDVLSQVNPYISIIYNGYDDELFYPSHQQSEQFRIVYTGRLLSLSMRNPKLLFDALKGDLLKDLELSLDFYTDDYSAQLLLAQEWAKDEPRLHIFRMKPSQEVPKLLADASVILLLSNEENSQDAPKGMLTTKLFEAMAMAKPCLLCPIKEGEAVSLLEEANCGIATNSSEEIAQYIYNLYQVWRQKAYTEVVLNDAFVQNFSRRRQAKEFAERLNQTQ